MIHVENEINATLTTVDLYLNIINILFNYYSSLDIYKSNINTLQSLLYLKNNIIKYDTTALDIENKEQISKLLTGTPLEKYFENVDIFNSTYKQITDYLTSVCSINSDIKQIISKIVRDNIPSQTLSTIIVKYQNNIPMFTGQGSIITYNSGANRIESTIKPAIIQYITELNTTYLKALSDVKTANENLKKNYASLIEARKMVYLYLNTDYYITKNSDGTYQYTKKTEIEKEAYNTEKKKTTIISVIAGSILIIGSIFIPKMLKTKTSIR